MKIERIGIKKKFFSELYYRVLKSSWPNFIGFMCLVYICANLIFASLYFLGGNCIVNARPNSFFDLFMFSVQTFATIGFGHFLPSTNYAHFIVLLESLAGIVYIAIFTGLIFAKFSRPTTHVIFSEKAVVVSYDGVPTLMFRMGNGRDTNIVDAKITCVTLMPQVTSEGHRLQRFVDLKLERSHSPFFILSWTVLHKIDSTSPFFKMTAEDFNTKDLSVFVSLVGYDETYSQTIHTAYRYQAKDIIFGHKFIDVVEVLTDGTRRLHFEKFHEVEGIVEA